MHCKFEKIAINSMSLKSSTLHYHFILRRYQLSKAESSSSPFQNTWFFFASSTKQSLLTYIEISIPNAITAKQHQSHALYTESSKIFAVLSAKRNWWTMGTNLIEGQFITDNLKPLYLSHNLLWVRSVLLFLLLQKDHIYWNSPHICLMFI